MNLTLEDLPPGVLDDVVDRLRQAEPAALAVLVTGSYATRRASTRSDLDLTVLTADPPLGHYRTWFDPRGRPPLHVSAGAKSLARWVERAQEPADWSLGFPTEEAGLFVWTEGTARATLGDPPVTRRPAAPPELEDFLECATKAQRASAGGASVGARWHAHDLATRAPCLLLPLNLERRVTDRRDALQAALEVPNAPSGYRDDLLLCLGLTAADDATVAATASRLARGVLAFLRQHRPDVDTQPDLARYLADGTLQRRLND